MILKESLHIFIPHEWEAGPVNESSVFYNSEIDPDTRARDT